MRKAMRVVLSLALCSALWGAQEVPRPEVRLKAAMHMEEVEGNLKAAIEQYKALAQSNDKSVAARALVRLGGCYEKQGNAEARKTYEQVLSKFGDQTDAVEQARARLAALGEGAESGIAARLVTDVPDGGSYMGPLSNDGRYVAFTTNLGGVFVHDLVSGEKRQVIGIKTPRERLFGAIISPDGKQVAYSRWPNTPGTPDYLCEIHVIDVDGSNPHHLAGGKDVRASNQAWSVDGKQLLASLNSVPDHPATERVLINVADGSQRVIGVGRMIEARFSPDGKYIAFTRRRDKEGSDIAVVPVEGGAEVNVTEHGGNATTPVWTPDGKKLLFLADWRSGASEWRVGNFDMWSIRVEQGKPAGPPEFVKERIDRIVDITRSGDCYYRTGVFSKDPPVRSNQLWVLKNLIGHRTATR